MENCLCRDFKLRGKTYEIWHDSQGNYLVSNPSGVVDTDNAFDPPLTNEEFLSIYNYRKGF